MRLAIIFLLISWSCTDEDPSVVSGEITGSSNVVGEQINPWTKSTSEDDKDDTIDTYFVNRRAGHPSDCVVIDAQQTLLDKIDEMLGANDDSYQQMRRQYRENLADSDILCYAKYHNGRKKNNGEKIHRYYPSFYHGTATDDQQKNSYQLTCFTNEDKYLCRDIAFKHLNDGKNFVVIEDRNSLGSQGIHGEIKKLDYYQHLTYDNGKKLLRVPVSDLKAKWREISPEKSQELSEYQLMRLKGRGKKWVQRIEKATYTRKNATGGQYQKSIFPSFCNTKASSVTSDRRKLGIQDGDPDNDNRKLVSNFQEVAVCQDLFLNPHNGNCTKELKEQKIKICKLEGRGILIKRGKSSILRVANCEYQPQAKHFYCSGKVPGSNKPPKIYFERYGVFIKQRSLPRADCHTRLVHRTDSIGCGQCPAGYDIAEELAERGCDYNTPHYCNHFSELESDWHSIVIKRPNRCDLQKTCAFRPTGSRWDNPNCSYTFEQLLKKAPDGDLYSDNGCSTEFDDDKCHFKKLNELDE